MQLNEHGHLRQHAQSLAQVRDWRNSGVCTWCTVVAARHVTESPGWVCQWWPRPTCHIGTPPPSQAALAWAPPSAGAARALAWAAAASPGI